jgi:hypothetical protein
MYPPHPHPRPPTPQLYAMDYRYLDPRRPLRPKATPEEAEERLLPYSELLPFAPLSYASQGREVAQLRGVAAAPGGLESTTLVLAVGGGGFYWWWWGWRLGWGLAFCLSLSHVIPLPHQHSTNHTNPPILPPNPPTHNHPPATTHPQPPNTVRRRPVLHAPHPGAPL